MIKIIYGEKFPFNKPSIKFLVGSNFCLFDLDSLDFRDIIKEDFHPSLELADIVERS